MTPEDQRLWSTLVHVGGIFLGFWAPLIGYLLFKDRGTFIRQHSATALNFQLTMLIANAVGVVLIFVFFIGVLLLIAVWILTVVFGIMGAMAANSGQSYKYPVAIDFVS